MQYIFQGYLEKFRDLCTLILQKPCLPEQTVFYKNCMGVGSGGKRSISFLGKVKKIMIRGNPYTSEESAGRLMLLGKGQLCFIVPDVCVLVGRENVHFQSCACKQCSISDTLPSGKSSQWGNCFGDAVQLVTWNPVGELCSYLSVSGKIKEAASCQAI